MDEFIERILEFDPSDEYHAGDPGEPGFYSAIDRVVRLLQGEIEDWQSPHG